MISAAFNYVVSDPYFWSSMAFTTMVGIFIGAVVHNGDVTQLKKTLISISSYTILILTVNLRRIAPLLVKVTPEKMNQPFASPVTILLVSLFYLLGILLGVLLVKKAYKK